MMRWTRSPTGPGDVQIPAIWGSDAFHSPWGCRVEVVLVGGRETDFFRYWDVGAAAVAIIEYCLVERGPSPGYTSILDLDRARVYLYAPGLGRDPVRDGLNSAGGSGAAGNLTLVESDFKA